MSVQEHELRELRERVAAVEQRQAVGSEAQGRQQRQIDALPMGWLAQRLLDVEGKQPTLAGEVEGLQQQLSLQVGAVLTLTLTLALTLTRTLPLPLTRTCTPCVRLSTSRSASARE